MPDAAREELHRHSEALLTENDWERSATSAGLPALIDALTPLADRKLDKVLDIGCGFGGLTRVAGENLGASELHGVDIDSSVIEEAAGKGVAVKICEAGAEPLPYEDSYFDFVMSLGMIDYLPTFDGMLDEIRRVLRPGGFTLMSIQNLGSWNSRLAMLFGYQPRDVEISERRVVGVAPYYRDRTPTGHIHTATLRAFVELMDIHGFDQFHINAGSWMTRDVATPVAFVDRILARYPSLARRFFYVGVKSDRQVDETASGWWQKQEG